LIELSQLTISSLEDPSIIFILHRRVLQRGLLLT
jgi:hypothetical protein